MFLYHIIIFGDIYICNSILKNPFLSKEDKEFLVHAAKLAQKYDFILAIDECYSEIYTERAPPGGLSACKELANKCQNILVFHSLSKRSNAPGLRSGFVAGDSNLIKKLLIHHHGIINIKNIKYYSIEFKALTLCFKSSSFQFLQASVTMPDNLQYTFFNSDNFFIPNFQVSNSSCLFSHIFGFIK